MRPVLFYISIFLSCLLMLLSCKKKETVQTGTLSIESVTAGAKTLVSSAVTTGIPVDSSFCLRFSVPVDTASIRTGISIKKSDQTLCPLQISFSNAFKSVWLRPVPSLLVNTSHLLTISSSVKGAGGETFKGASYTFITVNGTMTISQITINGNNFNPPTVLRNISRNDMTIEVLFSDAIDTNDYTSRFYLSENAHLAFTLSPDHKTVTVRNASVLKDITRYFFNISTSLKGANGYSFNGFSNTFYTELDSTYKFPPITDEELLTLVQQKTFAYFWDFGHPACGMARERSNSGDIVTTGGSGFGVMALIVGMNRGFITRDEGLTRLAKIVSFLETCDRFHGAWPHWLNGNSGKVVAFTTKDDGADLVETSYMIEGLLTMRQYLNGSVSAEQDLIDRINTLVNAVEYTWFTQGQNVLYWHWSPNYGWAMNMQIRGYNETLITYIVAACSQTYAIAPVVYHQGYARNGGIKNGNSYYGYVLPLGEPYGGPLFFTHYSFLGLDPRNLSDQYASYWQQNVNQSLINMEYCKQNPHNFLGYSADCWGLTACDNPWGYDAHSPTNDQGVIAPTAAISAIVYTPTESMRAIRHFYYILGNRLFGDYGFYDAFDETDGWWDSSTIAIDEGPIICMIENYRSRLLWNLFMSCPEVQAGLTSLGFTYK